MHTLKVGLGSMVIAAILVLQGCATLPGQQLRGDLERADLAYVRGWAHSVDDPAATMQVRIYATHVAASQRPPRQPYLIGQIPADEPREPHGAAALGGNPNHGFSLAMPACLLDGKDHRITASCLNPVSGAEKPIGKALTFNSTVLYQQEEVHDLHWNTQVFYTAAALEADPTLQNGFINPDLNAQYGDFNTGHTQFAMFGQLSHPAPRAIPFSLKHLTGLRVPQVAVESCQIGVDGGEEKGVNALQAHDTSLGVSLAPRALTDQPFIHGVFGLYNWVNPPAPFAGQLGDRLRVEGQFRHPYASVKPVGEGLIAQEGAVFFYYTLQFRDTTQNRDLWFVVRLYQDKFARPSDPWTTLMDGDALAVDGTNPETSIGLIDVILRPDATRVTPLPGSSYFSLAPFSGEKTFAFELSGNQFRQAVRDLNHADVAHVVFSEEPADYTLKHYNVNVESWAPSPECDPRIGLSWRDVKLSIVRAEISPGS